VHVGELAPFHVPEQSLQRTAHDLRGISRGNRLAQQLLQPPEHAIGLAVDRDLHPIATRDREDFGIELHGGSEIGDERLHFPFALPPCSLQKGQSVVVCEPPPQQGGRRHRQLARREHVQDHREARRRPRRLHPRLRFVLRQTEMLLAVREQRRIPQTQIEVPRIELGQRGDEFDGAGTIDTVV